MLTAKMDSKINNKCKYLQYYIFSMETQELELELSNHNTEVKAGLLVAEFSNKIKSLVQKKTGNQIDEKQKERKKIRLLGILAKPTAE